MLALGLAPSSKSLHKQLNPKEKKLEKLTEDDKYLVETYGKPTKKSGKNTIEYLDDKGNKKIMKFEKMKLEKKKKKVDYSGL